jgi:hypothetical protein
MVLRVLLTFFIHGLCQWNAIRGKGARELSSIICAKGGMELKEGESSIVCAKGGMIWNRKKENPPVLTRKIVC